MDLKQSFADAPWDHARYGVVGWPLGHTLSPAMHGAAIRHFKLKAAYRAVAVAPEDWGDFIRQAAVLPLNGFNVTLPYKEQVRHESIYRDGDELSVFCHAANTVRLHNDAWEGHNTDGPGFLEDLEAQDIAVDGRDVVLLGAGGSARALLFAFHVAGKRPARVTIVNRSQERGRLLVEDFQKVAPGSFPVILADEAGREAAVRGAGLLVNATSVGLAPSGRYPMELSWLNGNTDVYDLVYHRETELMSAAEKVGARVSGGLGMLARQAAHAFQIWFGMKPPLELLFAAAAESLSARQGR